MGDRAGGASYLRHAAATSRSGLTTTRGARARHSRVTESAAAPAGEPAAPVTRARNVATRTGVS
jgi:hypothetical protein